MIDEKKLIEEIKDVEVAWYLDGNYTTYDSTTIMDIIEEQPKVGEWILCSERLPENETEVEISCIRRYIGAGNEKKVAYITARAFYTDGTMTTEDSSFYWEDTYNWEYDEEKDAYIIPEGWWEYVTFSEQFGVVDAEVVAWMPLPEVYKG